MSWLYNYIIFIEFLSCVSQNKQKDIISFLRTGYEPFHLTGDEGILEELDEYVFGARVVH